MAANRKWIFVNDISQYLMLPWNEKNGVLGHLCAHIGWPGQENLLRMVRWMRWHRPPDTGFEIRALAVWGRDATSRARRLPTIFYFYEWAGSCFFETWRPEWGSNPRSPTFQARSFNHCTRTPAPNLDIIAQVFTPGGDVTRHNLRTLPSLWDWLFRVNLTDWVRFLGYVEFFEALIMLMPLKPRLFTLSSDYTKCIHFRT